MHPNSNEPDQIRWVPVVSKTGKPLMPCHPARARKLVAKGKATGRWSKGLYYIILTEREDGDTQAIALGIDPGSKMEGYTVKSEKRTLINIQSHAIDGKAIQKSLETRKGARRARRYRKTPCRACRPNRAKHKDWLPPSTKARWQLKYNIFRWLSKLYPIAAVVIEDVKARTVKGAKRWNDSFSPIQQGKNWLYNKLNSYGVELVTIEGYQTYEMRNSMGLFKSKNKLATIFSAHCVDSWVLANHWVGGYTKPDLETLIVLKPLTFTRRQLHRFNPSKGGERSRYGGTISYSIRRGTLAIHPKYGYCLIGGNDGQGRLSLHAPLSGSRLCQNAKPSDLTLISYSPWSLYDQTVTNHIERKAMRRQLTQLRHQQRHLSSSPD